MKNSDFLLAAYGELAGDYGWVASFASDPNDPAAGAWAGQAWTAKPTQVMFVDSQLGNNNFYSVGVMHTDDAPKRSKGLFKRLAVLLADDADPGSLMGPASYILETSPGNYQIGIFLDPEDPDTSDGPLIDIVLSYMASKGIINADASGNNPVRYGRLPEGRNTKKAVGGFAVDLHHIDGDLVYSLEDAAAAFGIDLAEARAWAKNPPVQEVHYTNPKMDGVEAFKQLINPDLSERSYHDPLLKISAAMVAKGMTPDGALGMIRSLMLAIKPDEGAELARWEARFGNDLHRMVKGAQKYAPEPTDDGSVVLTLDELEARTMNVNWLVKGLVPRDSMGMLFGGSGTYKSFISLDLALHIAHGMDWAGRRTEEGAVLVVAAEGGAGIYRRIQAWHQHHGLERTKNVFVCITPLILSEAHSMDVLRNSIAKMPVVPALVIIDTLAQTFAGVENDSSDISAYLRGINSELRAEFNTSVIIVHHSGHTVAERPRGSSALIGNLDYILGVFRPEGDERVARLSVVKQKDADKVEDLHFDMRHIVLGVDEDDEEISSLVAECSKSAPAAAGRSSKYDGAIMQALYDGPKTERQLKDATSSLSDNPKTAQRGLRDSLKRLQTARQVKSLGGSAWALMPTI